MLVPNTDGVKKRGNVKGCAIKSGIKRWARKVLNNGMEMKRRTPCCYIVNVQPHDVPSTADLNDDLGRFCSFGPETGLASIIVSFAYQLRTSPNRG